MLKREIKYEDFDGNEVTEIFYFNISKPEVLELQTQYKGGLHRFLQSIIETDDQKELIKKFKELILLAYGEKSPDGKRFVKSDQLREEFSQTEAYNTLFMELATQAGKAAEFFQSVLPKDLSELFDQKDLQTLPQPTVSEAPPLPPS